MRDFEFLKPDSETSRAQTLNWDFVPCLSPHKIFLWDKKGTYLDCEFPNPVHGHFFGGENLCGLNVAEVLPAQEDVAILEAIGQALASHQPTVVCIEMGRQDARYQAVIRLLPMKEMVIGWVNDFPIHAQNGHGTCTLQNTQRQIKTRLTSREWEIATLVTQQKSNEEIAKLLSISQRTVKYHVSHVLEKLQVTSRAHVKSLLPLLH